MSLTASRNELPDVAETREPGACVQEVSARRCTNCYRGTWPGFVIGWISATLPEPRRSPDAYCAGSC